MFTVLGEVFKINFVKKTIWSISSILRHIHYQQSCTHQEACVLFDRALL